MQNTQSDFNQEKECFKDDFVSENREQQPQHGKFRATPANNGQHQQERQRQREQQPQQQQQQQQQQHHNNNNNSNNNNNNNNNRFDYDTNPCAIISNRAT